MGGSSASRRRKASRRRFSPRPGTSAVPATTQEFTFDSLAITNGIGYDLLLKSGWQPGSPLGQSPLDTGAPSTPLAHATPLSIFVKRGRAGLGAPQTAIADDPVNMAKSAPERGTGIRGERLRAVVSGDIFDPLRPRCQYDSSHVVRNLKMLKKHEMSCPANPTRGEMGGANGRGSVVTVGNLFGQLALGENETESESESESEEEQGVMSEFSADTETEDIGSMLDGECSLGISDEEDDTIFTMPSRLSMGNGHCRQL